MSKISKLGVVLITWLFITECLGINRAAGYENWQIIGPGGGGQITSITEDHSNPDNLYITINTGGARKSTDGGTTWQIINRGFDYQTLGNRAQRMMDIAVHPNNSNAILAAGINGDIYMSTDGGEEWELSYRHPSGESEEYLYHFSRFVFDPGDPDVVYIGVGSIQKLFLGVSARRTGEFWPKINIGPTIIRGEWDGNEWNWEAVGSIEGKTRGCDETGCGKYLNIYSIGVHPGNTRKLFFVTERGVYKGKIQDDGKIESFKKIKQGLPKSSHIHGGKIVFDRKNPGIAYLSILNLDNKKIKDDGSKTPVGGIFKSVDGGKTWFKLTKGLDDNSNYFDIQIDPNNSEILYVAQFFIKVKGEWVGGNLYRSEDSGDEWEDLVQHVRINVDAGWQQADVDKKKRFGVHFIGVSRNNVVHWNKGGILCESDDLSKRYPQWTNVLTENVGEDDEWTTTGCEAIALAHSIAIDPKDSDTVYLPYGDHKYFKSTNGGDSLRILVGNKVIKDSGNTYDSGTLIVDRIDSERLYVATQGPHQELEDGGVMYSENGGENWATIGWHLKDYSGQDKSQRGAKSDLLIEYVGGERNLYVANYGNTSSHDETQGGVYLLEGFDGTIDPDAIDYWNDNWQKIFPVEIGEYMNGTYALAARNGFNTLYVGVNNEEYNEYGLYKLTKMADEWHSEGLVVSDEPDSQFNQSNAFNDMETGPESDTIYIATDKGLFVLDQDDKIIELIVPQFEALRQMGVDPDVKAIEIHSSTEDIDIIYVASPKTEILKSTDRGVTWTVISEDIPTLGFLVLKVDPNQDVIYAESPAAGIWKRSFESD